MATRRGTWDYYDRFTGRYGRTYFRRFGDGVVSSIGIGTYLGEATDEADGRYREAIERALSSGCNLVDTAINYRHQRAERVVGEALRGADVDREEVVVATKGGVVPFDGHRPDDPGDYVRSEYVEPGIVDADDLVRGIHCIDPGFLDHQLDRSRENLGLETVDCYYVHNPEVQLEARPREAVYDRLEAAFERLEERALAGDVRWYGVATWEAFRVPPGHDRYLSLPEVVRRARAAAREAGSDGTHLRAIQLPFDVAMADAYTVAAHEGADGPKSALEFARDADLNVFASASLLQGDLAVEGAIPDAVDARLVGDTPAQRAINFARSAPAVTAALVGMGSREHVEEDLAAGTFDAMGAEAFDATFG